MSKQEEWTVSYKQIGIVIFTFSLGVISALLISNSQSTSTTSFTTTELIGFVLSVILSGASIVLAISAIALGKSSEQAVIERSDESIRLQNEVFVRTTEALQRIESSTGVTEKRIEDIITGRVGDISQKIAGFATEGNLSSKQGKKELEEEIRSALMDAIKGTKESSEVFEYELMMKKRQERESQYEKFHQGLMKVIQAIPGVSVGKIGHGSISKSGDDQVDGIFTYVNQRIGVSTFRNGTDEETMEEFFRGAANQIEEHNFSKIVVFSCDWSKFEEISTKLLKPYKDELKNNIFYKSLDSSNIDVDVVQGLITNNQSKAGV